MESSGLDYSGIVWNSLKSGQVVDEIQRTLPAKIQRKLSKTSENKNNTEKINKYRFLGFFCIFFAILRSFGYFQKFFIPFTISRCFWEILGIFHQFPVFFATCRQYLVILVHFTIICNRQLNKKKKIISPYYAKFLKTPNRNDCFVHTGSPLHYA